MNIQCMQSTIGLLGNEALNRGTFIHKSAQKKLLSDMLISGSRVALYYSTAHSYCVSVSDNKIYLRLSLHSNPRFWCVLKHIRIVF